MDAVKLRFSVTFGKRESLLDVATSFASFLHQAIKIIKCLGISCRLKDCFKLNLTFLMLVSVLLINLSAHLNMRCKLE